MPANINLFATIIGTIVAVVVIVLVTYKAFYRKAPPDSALVISGGKKKRVVFGGALVNPIVHTTQRVSLNTMQLKVERAGQEAFITKDSLRVDIEAQFYAKIEPKETDVLSAVASLGDKTLTPEAVKTLLEGKLVGVLRSVAATMDLQELHEQRQDFADKVQEACFDDLQKNGFTLETVAVTNLDQTPLDQLDGDNRFDAVAIQTIKKEVEEKQTETARIENENRVKREEDRLKAELQIKEREEESQTKGFEVEKRLAFAQALQRKEVATNKAEQDRAVREHELQQQQAIEEARLRQEEIVKSAEIAQKQKLETARIAQQRQVQEAEIAQKQALETARVLQEQEVQAAEIQRDRAIEQAKIEQQRAVEEATIAKRIALIEKNREEKEAQATSEIQIALKEKERELAQVELLAASAERAKAEAQVETVTALEEAERQSKIALIQAEQDANRERIAREKITDAEAYAVMEAAKADLEAARLNAEAQQILAKSILVEAKAKAEGEEALIAAKNAAEQKVLVNDAILALIQALPQLTEQLMKPAEHIESIRVLDLGGNGANGSHGSMSRILGSILNAGAAIPALKEMLHLVDIEPEKVAEVVRRYAAGPYTQNGASVAKTPEQG